MEMAIFITACAALITGIANIAMIFEMKEQKRAMSSPALKLPGKYCKATYKENFWEWDVDNMHGLPLELINFGAGPAFNVSVNWLVDMKELLKAINQLDSKMDGMLQIGNTFYNIKLQNNKEFHAIPAYDKKEVNRIWIPNYYVCAFTEFLDLEIFDNENMKAPKWPSFPCIMADISCEDIIRI